MDLWHHVWIKFWFSTTLQSLVCCNPLLYSLYNIWPTAQFQTSLTVCYISIPFQKNLLSLLPLFSFSVSLFSSFFRSFPHPPIIKSVSTGASASNAMFEGNRSLRVHFVEAIKTTDFRVHFKIGGICVKQFLEWIMLSNAVPAKKIVDMTRSWASTHSKPSKLTTFASFPDSNL